MEHRRLRLLTESKQTCRIPDVLSKWDRATNCESKVPEYRETRRANFWNPMAKHRVTDYQSHVSEHQETSRRSSRIVGTFRRRPL